MKITATLIKNHITKILYFFLIFHIKKWRLGEKYTLKIFINLGIFYFCKTFYSKAKKFLFK